MLQIPESRRPLSPTAEPKSPNGEISKSAVRPVEGSPEEDVGLVASLRKSLADKEAALQRASYAAIRLQKQLEDALKQNQILRKQLKLGPQRPGSAAVAKASPPRPRVAPRQREVSRKLALAAAERSKQKRFRLAATAVSIAVLILIWGIWSQLPKPMPALAQREIPAALPPDSKLPPDLKPLRNAKSLASPGVRFEASLSRLNRALLYAPFGSPEQVLRQVRQSGKSPVCDFSWNYGQPALLYKAGIPLDVALDRCAAAVESYSFQQAKTPAEGGRGG